MSMLLFASASSTPARRLRPLRTDFRNLVAANRLVAIDHDFTDWTKDLIAHARAGESKYNNAGDQPFATGTVILSIGCPLGSMTKATVEFSRRHIPVR